MVFPDLVELNSQAAFESCNWVVPQKDVVLPVLTVPTVRKDQRAHDLVCNYLASRLEHVKNAGMHDAVEEYLVEKS